jgi:hypothetical protein
MKTVNFILLFSLFFFTKSYAQNKDDYVYFTAPVTGTEWMQGTDVTLEIQNDLPQGSCYGMINFLDGTDIINQFYWEGLVDPGLNTMEIYLDPDIYPASANYTVSFGQVDDPICTSDIFSIIEMQNITQIINPNTDSHWYYQNTETIEWYCYNTINVKIEVSTDNGNNWSNIENSFPVQQDGYNYYEWQIDIAGLTSGQSYTSIIKISDADNLSDNIESESFIIERHTAGISEVPISDNNNWWYNNTMKRISWISHEIPTVDIEYSTDGTTWIPIANNINCSLNGTNSMFWNVPENEFSTINSNSFIKVKETGNETNFAISPAFTLADVPKIDFLNVQTEYEFGKNYTLQIQNNTSETYTETYIAINQHGGEHYLAAPSIIPGINNIDFFVEPSNYSFGSYITYDYCFFKIYMGTDYNMNIHSGIQSNTFAIIGEQPEISTTKLYLMFGDVELGETSDEQSFSVQAQYLLEDVQITAPESYEISLISGSGFTNSLTLTQTAGTVIETEVFVRFLPNSEISYNDYLNIQSNYTLPQRIELIGTGINTSK